jgi:hypothetical protein
MKGILRWFKIGKNMAYMRFVVRDSILLYQIIYREKMILETKSFRKISANFHKDKVVSLRRAL